MVKIASAWRLLAAITFGITLFGCERAPDPKADNKAQEQAHRENLYRVSEPSNKKSKGF